MNEKREPRVNFTVRLPWPLRQRVHTAAHLAGQSVNEWMLDAIERKTAPGSHQTPPAERKGTHRETD